MLVALRRSAASHALRCSTRTLTARSTPRRLQSLYALISGPSSASKSLFHSTSFRFNSQVSAIADNGTEAAAEIAQESDELGSRFKELAEKGIVSESLVRTLTQNMRLENMTDVQRLTIPETVKGGDVLAQAKTGTGKTIAFLVPVLERLLRDPTVRKARFMRGRAKADVDIRAIIVSPTRELAEQIAVEAKRVAASTGLIVQTAVGGTQKREGLQRIRYDGCHILVGTPGRLKDILSDPSTGVEAPKLSAFVLDEADRLLDDGFAPELMEIKNQLPDPQVVDRQTLMFSATIAREVMNIVRKTMKPDFKFIKTVSDDEVPTHLSVPQKAAVLAGLENAMPAVLELAKRNKDNTERPFKAIAYFSSTKQVETAYEIFDTLCEDPEKPRSGHPLGRMFLGQIHSRLTQGQRTRVANDYRKCKSGILFSSDVTARGMDFPGVTHVLQIGAPRARDDYIHRIGRTARAGKTGEGWLFLHEQELRSFRNLVRDIPIEVDDSLTTASVDLTAPAEELNTTPEAEATINQMKSAIAQMSPVDKGQAIKTQFANLMSTFRDRGVLQQAIENLAVHGYGLRNAPPLPADFKLRSNSGRNSYKSGYGSHTGNVSSNRGGSYGRRDRDSFGRGGRDYGDRNPYSRRDSFGMRRDRDSARGPARHQSQRLDRWLDNRRDEWS
ncbi:P-loop containing nucleoside triphosphate hydrolase protein [Aspergillus undulatus]|uniref:P-loop containing nucleoside triphosphate hydrolase protein n=1 Tax=Aspergillus undulatus TaxID=1810928 RepID=UPI003CCD1C00